MHENPAETNNRQSRFSGYGRFDEQSHGEHENEPEVVRQLFSQCGLLKHAEVKVTDELWAFSVIVQDNSAIEVQDGDLFDFILQPYFRTFLELKRFHSGEFELEIAVNKSGPSSFMIDEIVLAMLSSLNVEITVVNGLKSAQ